MAADGTKSSAPNKITSEQTLRKLGGQIGLLKAELNQLRRGLDEMAQRFEPW